MRKRNEGKESIAPPLNLRSCVLRYWHSELRCQCAFSSAFMGVLWLKCVSFSMSRATAAAIQQHHLGLHCTSRSGTMVLPRSVAAASMSGRSAMNSRMRAIKAMCRQSSRGRLAGASQPERNPRLIVKMGRVSALARIASLPALNAAFSHIYSNSSGKSKHTSGVDHQTLNDFHNQKDSLLRQLSIDLMGKKFSFSKLSPHFIQKSNGKYRVICVPTVRDRVVQRALLDYLSTKYEAKLNNQISYGFLRGKGVQQAAEQSCRLRKSKPWVFKTDIAAFFDRVPRDLLKERLRKLVLEPSLLPLLESVIDSEIFINSKTTEKRIAALGIEVGIGIRQGMPMSPFFSNVMLNRFDKAIVQMGYAAVRYADDLIFFGVSESECKAIHLFCEKNLTIEGLTIPPLGDKSKSQIYSEGATAEFLGLGLIRCADKSYSLVVTKEQAIHIRTELFKLTDLEHLHKQNIDFFKFGYSLNSRIGGYVNAYSMCSNLKEFEDKLESIRLRIYSTVLSNLGIVPASLTPAAKRFFRLIE